MNNNNNFMTQDLRLSPYIGLPLLDKHNTKGINDLSLNNIINRNEEIKLENNKSNNNKKEKMKGKKMKGRKDERTKR